MNSLVLCCFRHYNVTRLDANARPIQRPVSPAGSQTGSVTPGPGQENPGGPASLPANAAPYQMIPAYYDAKGALVQLPGAGGLPPPVERPGD